jgi:2'-5' RNA ligase
MNRIFIALEIPGEQRSRLMFLRDETFGNLNVRWEPEEKLHLTLKFIGDTNDEQCRIISSALDFLLEQRSFMLSFHRFGFFFKNGIPTILWAGLHESPALNGLVHRIDSKISELGIPHQSSRFWPHITLLRIRDASALPQLTEGNDTLIDGLTFPALNIVLFKSHLLQHGSKYSVIKKYSLISG